MRTFQARYPNSAFSKLSVDFKRSYLPFLVDDVGFGYSDAFGKGPPLGLESGWHEGRVMKQQKMQRQRFGRVSIRLCSRKRLLCAPPALQHGGGADGGVGGPGGGANWRPACVAGPLQARP